MDRGVLLPDGDGIEPTSFAARLDDLGYGAIRAGELWDEDLFVRLADIAPRVVGRAADCWIPHSVPFGRLGTPSRSP